MQITAQHAAVQTGRRGSRRIYSHATRTRNRACRRRLGTSGKEHVVGSLLAPARGPPGAVGIEFQSLPGRIVGSASCGSPVQRSGAL